MAHMRSPAGQLHFFAVEVAAGLLVAVVAGLLVAVVAGLLVAAGEPVLLDPDLLVLVAVLV